MVHELKVHGTAPKSWLKFDIIQYGTCPLHTISILYFWSCAIYFDTNQKPVSVFIKNPNVNPFWILEVMTIPYGNNGSLDPGTYNLATKVNRFQLVYPIKATTRPLWTHSKPFRSCFFSNAEGASDHRDAILKQKHRSKSQKK